MKMKNLKKYTIYFVALNLFVLGLDKFFLFIPESCTLMVDAPKTVMYSLGVVEVLLAILLATVKFTKIILILICVLMAQAIGMHLFKGTYDIGGAVFILVFALVPLMMSDDRVVV